MRSVPSTPSAVTFARLLGDGPMARVALQASLDFVGAPAYIVSSSGTVLCANRRGDVALAEAPDGGAELRAALVEATQLDHPPRKGAPLVTPLRCEGASHVYFLVILRSPSSLEENVALVAQLWELTDRQAEVLRLVAEGYTNKTIATKLKCTERTVESHLTHIFGKSGVTSRTALLAALARERR